MFDHERARRWRVSGSLSRPRRARLAQNLVELLLETSVAGGRRRAALEAERRHGDLPPVVHPADDVGLRAAHIGEEDLVELRGAIDLLNGTHLHPGLLHRYEEIGDAGVLRGVGVGSGQQEDVVGVVGLRRPHLLSVDHPLVAVELGPRLQAGQVRTGVGLTESLAPRDLTLQDPRYELLLLFLRAPLQDRRANEGVAEEVGAQRRTDASELLVEHDLLQQAQALAAVFGGPTGADPPAPVELRRPLLVEGLALLGCHGESGAAPALGEVLLEPSGDLSPELLGFGRVGQVHGGTVPAPLTSVRAVTDRMPSVPPSKLPSAMLRGSLPHRDNGEGGVAMSRGEPPSSRAGACPTPCQG